MLLIVYLAIFSIKSLRDSLELMPFSIEGFRNLKKVNDSMNCAFFCAYRK
jgi:hypothetical protein